MKDAVLYVFYTSPRTCSRRLKLMRSFSPNASFYGICTEQRENLFKFKPVFDELDDGWTFPFVNPKWHWHNLDKIVCQWFVERGAALDFDRLLVLDWDVLLMGPVSEWTSSINERRAEFIEVWENTEPEANHWTRSSNPEFIDFCSKFQERNGARPPLHNGFLFAYAVPRRALEDCAAEVLTYSGFCEYRLPTILRNRGYELGNLPRTRDWQPLANVNGRSISPKLIRREMVQPRGQRLFHPVYEPYVSEDLRLSIGDWIAEGCLYRTCSRSVKEFLKRGLRLFSAGGLAR